MSILGSDEVGTGDYFGPMTVVAVYVDAKQIPLLKELGVKDSKNLNDAQIAEIANNYFLSFPIVPLYYTMKNIMKCSKKETIKES